MARHVFPTADPSPERKKKAKMKKKKLKSQDLVSFISLKVDDGMEGLVARTSVTCHPLCHTRPRLQELHQIHRQTRLLWTDY
ncbi:hypothetical protein GDO81_020263 [Engystomops pustulosus]|uniref:Uncharacterized protein n=1 Tax=Engystomops pustulosus TaxID=76066 RepID=A0AAV6ZTG5_ENGPU|nr:hypothetical protein GDO81_020263 [Engystomops pustulosus]